MKVKIISILLCVVMILSQTFINISAAVYYSDDSFRQGSAYDVSPASGWDFDKSGGTVYIGSASGIQLEDTSYAAPVSMRKKIITQNSGSLTAEVLFKLNQYTDGFSIRLSGSGNTAVEILTESGKLKLIGKNGQKTELTTYTKQKNIGLKLYVNFDNGSVTAFVNGVNCATAQLGSDRVDEIKISTPESYKVTAFVSGVKLYCGYSLNERFIVSGEENTLPDEWTLKSGSAYICKQNNTAAPDVYSLYVGTAQTQISFPETGNKGRFEFRFLSNEANSAFAWKNGEADVAVIKAINGSIMLGNEVVASYVPNVWYRCELEVDFSANTAKLMINGKYVKENITLPAMKITRFCVDNTARDILIDDILAYTDESDAYIVPAPSLPEKDNVNIGVMRCDLWHEGSHYGWDKILPYSEREPYLGYYDDGNPDVSDWETKWLAEHGIDYSLHCWFLPPDYTGGPIKTPSNAYSLEDGYFHSKYSDRIDFAIMWENSSITSVTSDIFKSYIVPCWIEHYLKDSRYMVINNKPVIGIYSASKFLSYIGGLSSGKTQEEAIAQAKENLDYLRSECVKLGYDGAYILCTSNGSDVSNEKAIGFDAFHAYTWRDFTDNPETQKGYLENAMGNSSGMEVVPTVSVGIDEEPWGKRKGQMCSPETVQAVLEYVRDSSELLSAGDMGNMLLLDNWNEYGEGHFMMPTGVHGFGYLDAVRSVFVGDSSHTDEKPSEADKAYLGTLYPDNREATPRGEVTIPVRTDSKYVVKEWSGWNLSSWNNGNSSISSLEYERQNIFQIKALVGTATGTDPSITCSDDLSGIDMKKVNYVAVEIARNASDPNVALYYKSIGDEKFTEAKSIYTYAQSNGATETVYIPVWKDKTFSDGVKELRIDPINSKGIFKIYSVRLLSGEPTDKMKLIKDSSQVYTTVPILKSGSNYYAEMNETATLFGATVSYIRGERKIKLVKGMDIYEYYSDGALYENGVDKGTYSALTTSGKYYMMPLDMTADIFGYNMTADDTNGTITMNVKGLYPDIAYDISSDSENGLWKYRNLAESPQCDGLSNYWWGADASVLNVTNEVYHSPSGSIYKDFTGKYQRMGVEAAFKANTNYHFSAWLKNEAGTDSTNQMRLATDYTAYDKDGNKLSANQAFLSEPKFALDTTWQNIKADFRIDTYTKNNETLSIGDGNIGDASRVYVTQNTTTEKRVYMDDVNIREIPSFSVYTMDISHLSQKIGDEPIVFTFSHDIDPWSVTADKILINGTAATNDELRIDINTNEQSRRTQLSITLLNPPATEERVTVTLSEICDAWGREIVGLKEATAIGGAPYLKLTPTLNANVFKLSAQLMGEQNNATAIVALKADAQMKNAKIFKLTENENSFEFSVNENESIWENMEVFLWSDMERMNPISFRKTVLKEQFK